MKKGKPVDELKREHDAKLRKATSRQRHDNAEALANGHDKSHHIDFTWWNDLGAPTEQDLLVHGMLGHQQLAMMYGESSSGKSFTAFDLAAHVALGRLWFGRKVGRGAVLYIAGEGRAGWANRAAAFFAHHKLDEETRGLAPFAFVLNPVNIGRDGALDVAAIIDAGKRLADKTGLAVALTILDTMARVMPGSNENDPVDVGRFVGNCDLLREKIDTTPLIVHHSGKNAALGARGHSALRAAMDAEIEIERTKSSRILRVRKSRDGLDGLEIGFQLHPVEIGRTADGDPIMSCVLVPAEIEKPAAKGRKPTKAERLLVTVVDQALHAHGIELQLPDGGPTVKAVNREYVRNGFIHKRPDIKPDSARTAFDREIGDALTSELLLSTELSGTVWLYYPGKLAL